ncbi:PQQ-binding-like beta-propeller repeat protein [Streptomyces narbonensis]|uniref:PQQ-binding-like beta-propeller repeat protein n=1 Tax=Streptomyces narbonensis TaxID=67333 RepID=A0ABV3C5P4_9ACTN
MATLFVSGPSLADRVREGGRLPERDRPTGRPQAVLERLDPGTGKVSWSRDLPGAEAYWADLAVFGPTRKVMREAARGWLIATTLAGGKRKWELPMPTADGDPFIDGKGRAYVRRSAGQVLCLDGTSGRELWRSAPAQAAGSKDDSGTGTKLTVRSDGVVFAYTGGDVLAGFKPPNYTGTAL